MPRRHRKAGARTPGCAYRDLRRREREMPATVHQATQRGRPTPRRSRVSGRTAPMRRQPPRAASPSGWRRGPRRITTIAIIRPSGAICGSLMRTMRARSSSANARGCASVAPPPKPAHRRQRRRAYVSYCLRCQRVLAYIQFWQRATNFDVIPGDSNGLGKTQRLHPGLEPATSGLAARCRLLGDRPLP